LNDGKIAFLDRDDNSEFISLLNVGDSKFALLKKDMGTYVFISGNIAGYEIETFIDKVIESDFDGKLNLLNSIGYIPLHLYSLDNELLSLQSLNELYVLEDSKLNNYISYLDKITYDLSMLKNKNTPQEKSASEEDITNDEIINDLKNVLEILEANNLNADDVEEKIYLLEISKEITDKFKKMPALNNFVCRVSGIDGSFIAYKDEFNSIIPVSFPKGITENFIAEIELEEVLQISEIQG